MNAISLAVVYLLVFVASAQSQPSRNSQASPVSPLPSPLETALSAYSELTGKTVLRSSALPNLLASVTGKLPSETNAAAAFIESRLREQGIELIQDGLLFVRALPVGWTNSPGAAFLATLKLPLDASDGLVGAATFASADLDQTLAIYATLRSRTLLRPRTLPNRSLCLQARRDLTNQQLSYGITVLLTLNGIAAVDDGEKFVQVIPIEQSREAVTTSPKSPPGVPVLDPKELPKFKPERPPAAMDRLNRLYLQVFRQQPPWTPKPVDKLLEFYAELTDQKAAPSQNHGRMPVMFEVTTPLTKEELLYAIETTLKLEGLAIAKVDKNKIGAISLGEQRRLEGEKTAGSEIP